MKRNYDSYKYGYFIEYIFNDNEKNNNDVGLILANCFKKFVEKKLTKKVCSSSNYKD